MKHLALAAGLLLSALFVTPAAARQTHNLNLAWDFWYDGEEAQVQKVDLPHDFQIAQPWVSPQAGETGSRDQAANSRSRLSGRGFKEMKVGWYRKTILPDETWKNKRVLLDFGGIMLTGDVYLNGERIGGTDYGYLGFEIDITDKLIYGQDNELLVRADTGQPENSRWYTGGGLFRDVKLITTAKNAWFARHPLHITTEIHGNRAAVIIQAELYSSLRQTAPLTFRTTVLEYFGDCLVNEVADHVSHPTKYRSQSLRAYVLDTIWIDDPHLWSCEDPHLYSVIVEFYENGADVGQSEPTDYCTEEFGIREISFSPEYGFKLNGQKVLLKGCANHHSMSALGAACYPEVEEYQLRLLKSFGYNHVRTSHNPYSEHFLDLCDQLGILVVDELYDKWLKQYAGGRVEWMQQWPYDVSEFVKRDRNHPSVVMWSLGNELQQYANLPFNDWGVTPYLLQRELLHRFDTTRPVTVAMHPRYRSLETDSLPCDLALTTDIASYNYRYMYFPGDGRRFPHMIFYQSEANTVGMPGNFFEMDLDKVVGLAYWGAVDYIGESGGWPAKGWAQGAFDLSFEPKPIAWLVKSMFSDEPTVHIAIVEQLARDNVWNGVQIGTEHMSENWNRQAGELLSLYTYTNAEKVELRLNGRSLGIKENPSQPSRRNIIRWDSIAYAPGQLEAVAYSGGRIVARHRIETAGKAARLRADVQGARRADGTLLIHLTAVDSRSHKVATADDNLHLSVEGPARVVGVCSGDITSDEDLTGSTVRLYQGTAMVFVRMKGYIPPDKVTLTVRSERMGTQKIKLQ